MLIKLHNWSRSREISEVLSSIRSYVSMKVVSFALEDMAKASRLVEEYRMDWHDCLNVALMRKCGVEEVYSNDRHFDRVEGVKRIFT